MARRPIVHQNGRPSISSRTMHRLIRLIRLVSFSAALLALAPPQVALAPTPRFSVPIPRATYPRRLTGRLVLAIAKAAQPEPRLLISPRGPALFAVDLEALEPGQAAIVDDKSLGHPRSLAELPPGDYFAQAIVNVYEQVHRSDGKTIWVHMNDGRIEFFSIAPGNLYSDPVLVHVAPDSVVRITITHAIDPQPKTPDTDWIKQVTIQSGMLTRFWGRPVYIHA